MQKFAKTVITNDGQELLNSVIGSNGRITYTKAVMSTYDAIKQSQQTLRNLTVLNDQVMSTKIGIVSITDETAKISASFNNAYLLDDQSFNCIGWYASTTIDSAEKLIAISPSVTEQVLVAGSHGKATASVDLSLTLRINRDANVDIHPIEAGLIDETELKNSLATLSRELKNYTYDRKTIENKLKEINFSKINYSYLVVDDDFRSVKYKSNVLRQDDGTYLLDLASQDNTPKLLRQLHDTKADKSDTYTKQQVDEKLKDAGKVKTVDGFKPDSNGNVNTNTYSKTETKELIDNSTPKNLAFTNIGSDGAYNMTYGNPSAMKVSDSTAYVNIHDIIQTLTSNLYDEDFLAKQSSVDAKADKSDTYTKAEVDKMKPDYVEFSATSGDSAQHKGMKIGSSLDYDPNSQHVYLNIDDLAKALSKLPDDIKLTPRTNELKFNDTDGNSSFFSSMPIRYDDNNVAYVDTNKLVHALSATNISPRLIRDSDFQDYTKSFAKTVNYYYPDSKGNINIPMVRTVNGVSPDKDGDVKPISQIQVGYIDKNNHGSVNAEPITITNGSVMTIDRATLIKALTSILNSDDDRQLLEGRRYIYESGKDKTQEAIEWSKKTHGIAIVEEKDDSRS